MPAYFIEAHLHGSCHHLQKTSGAGGAFVVHHEARNLAALIQYNDLGVLSADVDDAADGGIEKVCSLCMAGDFRDTLIRILDRRSAVACGDDPADVLPPQICLAERLLQRLVRADPGAGTGGDHRPADDSSGSIQNHDVRRGGSGINAGKIGGLGPGLVGGILSGMMVSGGFRALDFLSERLQSCLQLSSGTPGIVGLDLEEGDVGMRLHLAVFKAVVVTEPNGVIDNAAEIRVVEQRLPPGAVHHAHAGKLAQEDTGIPAEERVIRRSGSRQSGQESGGERPAGDAGVIRQGKWHGFGGLGEELFSHPSAEYAEIWSGGLPGNGGTALALSVLCRRSVGFLKRGKEALA